MNIEDWPWITSVYGLSYPGLGIFYVGISHSPSERFIAHWAADGGCSSYDVIRLWKKSGRKFDHVIFGKYEDRVQALRLERALIKTLPGLVNSKKYGMLSIWRYPPNDVDEELLQEALEIIGMRKAKANIDLSGEYVDERYDEWDCVDA